MKKPIRVLRSYVLNRRRVENQKEMRRIAQEIHLLGLQALLKVMLKKYRGKYGKSKRVAGSGTKG